MTHVIGNGNGHHACLLYAWVFPDRMVLRCAICGSEEEFEPVDEGDLDRENERKEPE